MIPTMILFGLVFGRWWKVVLPAGAVVWVVILALAPEISMTGTDWLLAAILGAANTAAGVAVHQIVLALIRWLVARALRGRSTSGPAPAPAAGAPASGG